MRKVKFGNLLRCVTAETPGENVIIHGCNSHGVMGSGFAGELAAIYPACARYFASECSRLRVTGPTDLLGHCVTYHITPNLVIFNAITQKDFGRQQGKRYVSYEAVHEAFVELRQLIRHDSAVHYPLIGAGLGGGDWAVIGDIISSVLDPFDIDHTLWLLEP